MIDGRPLQNSTSSYCELDKSTMRTHLPCDNVVSRVPVAQCCLPRPPRLRRREGLGRRERLLQEALRPGHIVVAERGTAPRRGRHHKLLRNSPIINMMSTVLCEILN